MMEHDSKIVDLLSKRYLKVHVSSAELRKST